MSGYFKRMGQLARAGAPRHARAGPLSPQTPTLDAVSVEVPVTSSSPVPASAAAPTRPAVGQGGQAASTPRSPTLPPRTDSGDHTAVEQSSLPRQGLKSGSSSLSAPTPRAPHRASPPSDAGADAEPVDPPRESETLRNSLGSSPGPKTESVTPDGSDIPRNPVTTDAAPAPGPAREEPVVEGLQVLIEELSAPEASSKADPVEVRTTPVSRPLDPGTSELTSPIPEPATERILLPEQRGEAKPVEPSQRVYADDTPPPPLLAARKAKSDIEVNIGAITLSLDPEPVMPASTPAPRPMPKPRAGGIWSDGRGLARSYLRRI